MIIVSACLFGITCRYNGKSVYRKKLVELLKQKDYLLVCPEVCGGLKTPREPIELYHGKAIEKDGTDRTNTIISGCEKIMRQLEIHEIEYAVLQSKSPSCGKGMIYDGRFTGTLINGNGLFVDCLEKQGILVYDVDTFCTLKER